MVEISRDGAMVAPDSIVALSDLEPDQIDQVREIYIEAFPESERIPFAELLTPPPDEKRAVDVLVGPGGEVRGFACVYWLRGFPALMVEFLAVAARRRSAGHGTVLWRHIQDTARRTGTVGVVLEAEHPDEPGLTPEETDLRRRRIAFYVRGGAEVLPVPDYRVPSRVGGPDLPFALLWSPTPHGQSAAEVNLDGLVRTLLWESYAVAPPEAP